MSSDDEDIDFEEEHGEEHGEPWLVSYADLMTLLFGFFVLMYFFASQNKEDNWEKVRKEIAQHFGGDYVDKYDKIKEELKAALRETEDDNLLEHVEITKTTHGIKIMFQSTVLFDLGQADLRQEALNPVKNIVKLLKLKGDHLHIEVQGHTDNLPIATFRYPSNWELSAARAAAIIRFFESANYDRTNLRAVGLSDTKPLLPNVDKNGKNIPENQIRNRRVVIQVSNFHDFEKAMRDGPTENVKKSPTKNSD